MGDYDAQSADQARIVAYSNSKSIKVEKNLSNDSCDWRLYKFERDLDICEWKTLAR